MTWTRTVLNARKSAAEYLFPQVSGEVAFSGKPSLGHCEQGSVKSCGASFVCFTCFSSEAASFQLSCYEA